MDEQYKRNMQQSAAALGLVAMSLQQFSSLLIRVGLEAGALQPEVLQALREQTIRGLKNSQAVGISMETEADMIGQALRMLEPMIEEAIAEAQAQAQA